jgi:hypothetical protein
MTARVISASTVRYPINSLSVVEIFLVAFVVVGSFGCGGGSASVPPVPPPPAISVSLSQAMATVQAGATTQFTAMVANDAASKGVAWSVSCSTSACGSVSPTSTASGAAATYAAPNSAASSDLKVTLTATSVADATQSSSGIITVTPSLRGQYAFLFNGIDDASGQQVAVAGSFAADGAGNVIGGEEDINGPTASPLCNAPCPQLGVSITGTYNIGADNRGILSIKNAVRTAKYAIAVGSIDSSGVATKARFIEFDDTTGTSGTRGSGVMVLEDPAAFSLSKITGPYAFGVSGQSSSGGHVATAGRFDADGAGNIANGLQDLADDSAWVNNAAAFTGIYTAPDANGRVTGNFVEGATTTDFAAYIVSANQLLLTTTAAEATAGLQSGTVLSQASTSFTTDSMGALVIYGGVVLELGSTTIVGGFHCLAVDNAPVAGGSDIGGLLSLSTNGRGTTLPAIFNRSAPCYNVGVAQGFAVFYLVGKSMGFFVSKQNVAAESGFFEPQNAAAVPATISGNYFFGSAISSGVLTADGVNTMKLTSDASTSSGSLTAGQTQSLSYTLDYPISGTRRVTIGGTSAGYIISPTKFVFLDSSGPGLTIAEQ